MGLYKVISDMTEYVLNFNTSYKVIYLQYCVDNTNYTDIMQVRDLKYMTAFQVFLRSITLYFDAIEIF